MDSGNKKSRKNDSIVALDGDPIVGVNGDHLVAGQTEGGMVRVKVSGKIVEVPASIARAARRLSMAMTPAQAHGSTGN